MAKVTVPTSTNEVFEFEDLMTPGLADQRIQAFRNLESYLEQSNGQQLEKFEQLLMIGQRLQQSNDSYQAIGKYEEAIREMQAGPGDMLAFAYGSLALCYLIGGVTEKSLYYSKIQLEIAHYLEDLEIVIAALTNIGVAEYRLKNFRGAVVCHLKVLDLASASKSKTREASAFIMKAFGNLGNCHAALGSFKRAVVFHDQQLRIARLLEDIEVEAHSLFNLENDHNSMGNYAIGLHYKQFRKDIVSDEGAFELNSTFGDKLQGADIKTGWLYKHQGEQFPSQRKTLFRTKPLRKLWCILSEGLFHYYRTTQMNAQAERFVRLDEISSIRRCALGEDASDPEMFQSFEFSVGGRKFYFTCDSVSESILWVDALKCGKQNAFTVSLKNPQRQLQTAPRPLLFEEVPDSFRVKSNVRNPLFMVDAPESLTCVSCLDGFSSDDDEEEGTDGEDQSKFSSPLKSEEIPKDSATGSAWLHSANNAPPMPNGLKVLEHQLKLLGSQFVQHPYGAKLPSTHDVHKAYLTIKGNSLKKKRNLKRVHFRLLPLSIVIVEKGTSLETSVIPLDSVVTVLSFQTSIVLVIRQARVDVSSKSCFSADVYDCLDVQTASLLKNEIQSRTHRLRYADLYPRYDFVSQYEPEQLETRPIPILPSRKQNIDLNNLCDIEALNEIVIHSTTRKEEEEVGRKSHFPCTSPESVILSIPGSLFEDVETDDSIDSDTKWTVDLSYECQHHAV